MTTLSHRLSTISLYKRDKNFSKFSNVLGNDHIFKVSISLVTIHNLNVLTSARLDNKYCSKIARHNTSTLKSRITSFLVSTSNANYVQSSKYTISSKYGLAILETFPEIKNQENIRYEPAAK